MIARLFAFALLWLLAITGVLLFANGNTAGVLLAAVLPLWLIPRR